MSTFIPPTPAANKPAEQHQEPSEQDSFDHLLYKVLRLTSEQVQDLNGWMKHRGIPNIHETIAQNFRKPHALEDDLQFIREGKPCYIQSNVMISLSLMITYIKHLRSSAKTKYFGPFYYIQIDPQDYDEWRTTPPDEEVHFQTPSKLDSPATTRSMATSEASESYINLTNFKKGIKRDASAYSIFKNERYYNTFIRHFKATAKAQGLNSLMDPNFTPRSDEYEQQLFQEQQAFLYVENTSSLFLLISCSQGILNSSRLSCSLLPKIACLHVSFTAYENFYKLSKMHCSFILIFHFPFFRMSECRNPTIKHISNYTYP